VMQEGRPFPVLPGQDHATRVIEDANFLHSRLVKGVPFDPQAAMVIKQHMAQHLMYLKQTQPAALKQVMQQIAQIEAQPGPGNVAQLPQGQPQEQPQPQEMAQ